MGAQLKQPLLVFGFPLRLLLLAPPSRAPDCTAQTVHAPQGELSRNSGSGTGVMFQLQTEHESIATLSVGELTLPTRRGSGSETSSPRLYS